MGFPTKESQARYKIYKAAWDLYLMATKVDKDAAKKLREEIDSALKVLEESDPFG